MCSKTIYAKKCIDMRLAPETMFCEGKKNNIYMTSATRSCVL